MKMKNRIASGAMVVAASVAIAGYACATSVTFPDPGPGNYNFSPAASYDGVTFAASFPAISGVGSSIGADQVNFFDDTFGGHIEMTFAPAKSFTAVVSQGYPGTSGVISLTAYDLGTEVYSADPTVGGQDSFTPISISGVGPFTEVLITTSGSAQFPGIAQIDVGSAVPEASTWVLMLLGVGGLGLTLRVRRTDRLQAAT